MGLMKFKKAQEDSMITMVIALFIIIFIMAVYLFVVFVMAEKKSFVGQNDIEVKNFWNPENDASNSESLYAFLNSEVEFREKKQKANDAILSLLDNYFDTKSSSGESLIDKYGLYNFNDITRVSKSKMESDGFNGNAINKIEEEKTLLAGELRKKLSLYCERYKLGLAFGMITQENGGMKSSDALGDMIYFVAGEGDPYPVDWTRAELKTSYRGKNIKIEYMQLKKCWVGT